MISNQNNKTKNIKDITLGLNEMHLVFDAKSRLENIVLASNDMLHENDTKNDLWSIKEIGSYAIGFISVIDEIVISRKHGDTSLDKFHSLIERAEIFCGIAERACEHGQ